MWRWLRKEKVLYVTVERRVGTCRSLNSVSGACEVIVVVVPALL